MQQPCVHGQGWVRAIRAISDLPRRHSATLRIQLMRQRLALPSWPPPDSRTTDPAGLRQQRHHHHEDDDDGDAATRPPLRDREPLRVPWQARPGLRRAASWRAAVPGSQAVTLPMLLTMLSGRGVAQRRGARWRGRTPDRVTPARTRELTPSGLRRQVAHSEQVPDMPRPTVPARRERGR